MKSTLNFVRCVHGGLGADPKRFGYLNDLGEQGIGLALLALFFARVFGDEWVRYYKQIRYGCGGGSCYGAMIASHDARHCAIVAAQVDSERVNEYFRWRTSWSRGNLRSHRRSNDVRSGHQKRQGD